LYSAFPFARSWSHLLLAIFSGTQGLSLDLKSQTWFLLESPDTERNVIYLNEYQCPRRPSINTNQPSTETNSSRDLCERRASHLPTASNTTREDSERK
jgi:hypothetical protein